MATEQEVFDAFFTEGSVNVSTDDMFYADGVLYAGSLDWPLVVMDDNSRYHINSTPRGLHSKAYKTKAINALISRGVDWVFSPVGTLKSIIAKREQLNG